MKPAYYNEIEPYAAQWLRNLISAGHIAPGDVDERSIEDVRPDDLRGYTQCHFFAGIGVWSYALRLAGWPDDRPVWTGSCPCQPFSAAGKGDGFADERHLWPSWHWLIAQCRPTVIFGEQVASKDVEPWIDLVFTDLEATSYAGGALAFPSAGIGAPHIRDRAYFVAYADGARRQGRQGMRERATERPARARGVAGIVADADRSARGQGRPVNGGRHSRGDALARPGPGGDGMSVELADAARFGERADEPGRDCGQGQQLAWPEPGRDGRDHGAAVVLADADGGHAGAEGIQRRGQHGFIEEDSRSVHIEPAGPTNGFWRVADWLLCRDGKWRPVEPGTFPLADGAPSRMGRLRAYGNAINAEAAKVFIESCDDILEGYDLC